MKGEFWNYRNFSISLMYFLSVAVVIEEAGEVLETHVVASLTNKCQHVILIGR